MTKEEAIKIYETGWWEEIDLKIVVSFQLLSDRICMDFDDFLTGLNEVLGRVVNVHELYTKTKLLDEIYGIGNHPTHEELIKQIPKLQK